MQLIKAGRQNFSKEVVSLATETLKRGGIIICPTDTIYLIGSDATNEIATKKVFDLKGRSYDKPMHVIVSDLNMAKKYVKFTPDAEVIAKAFLPGPLTLVLEKSNRKLAKNLTGKEQTLGVRVPLLKLNREISKKLGGPYTATSANKSGNVNPYTVEQVISQFTKKELEKIDIILDGGNSVSVKPSTVVHASGGFLEILREGPISKNLIENVLK